MKKRIWVVGGSIGAGVILVLAILSTVVSAQIVKTDEKKVNIFQQIREKIENLFWQPGQLFAILVYLFILILLFSIYWGP